MEQTNIESRRVRKVKWSGAPLSIDDAPGGGSGLPAIASSSNADGNEDMTPGPVPLALPAADTTEPLVEEMVEEADALPASDSNRTSCHNKIRKTVQTDASRSSGATEVLQSTRDGT